MHAVTVAMGLLMWMWSAACLQAVRVLLPATAGAVRSGWLALLIIIGAGVLLALLLLVLPASGLSQGWTREALLATQQWTAAAVVLAGVAGGWRGHRQLQPAPGRPLAPAPAARQKKRP